MLGNMLNDLAEAIRRWTEKKLAYSKSDHVSHLFVLGYVLHCAVWLLFRLDSLLLLGRERRGFG